MQHYAIFGTGGEWEWNELGYLTTVQSDNISADLEKIARKHTAGDESWIKAEDLVCKTIVGVETICAHIAKIGLAFIADGAKSPVICVDTFVHDDETDLDEERDTFVAIPVADL